MESQHGATVEILKMATTLTAINSILQMCFWSETQLLTVVRHLNVFVQQKEEVVQDAYSSVDLGAEIKMQNESELN